MHVHKYAQEVYGVSLGTLQTTLSLFAINLERWNDDAGAYTRNPVCFRMLIETRANRTFFGKK